MCIRDSAQGAAVDDTPITSMSILNAKSPESFRKYREMGMMKPVSYTHLDVYKRQYLFRTTTPTKLSQELKS